MANSAMRWADARPEQVDTQNTNYRYLTDYDGPEWALGLIKTILLHQNEAIKGMKDNTVLTIAVYGIITVLILTQYLVLGMRIETLLLKNNHISKIVSRLETQCEHWESGERKNVKNNHADGADSDSGSDTAPDEISASDEELAETELAE